MKSTPFYGMAVLQRAAQVLAVLFCVSLLVAGAYEIYQVFRSLVEFNINQAIQEGLFTLIILEMVFVTRSFIKYGSVNTALILSVGVVAVVKSLIFNMVDIQLDDALAYSALILALTVGYVLENYTYGIKMAQGRQSRSIRDKIAEEYKESINLDVLVQNHPKENAILND